VDDHNLITSFICMISLKKTDIPTEYVAAQLYARLCCRHYVAVKLLIVLGADARGCTVHMLGMTLQTRTAPT
jgi:hypothetical protein